MGKGFCSEGQKKMGYFRHSELNEVYIQEGQVFWNNGQRRKRDCTVAEVVFIVYDLLEKGRQSIISTEEHSGSRQRWNKVVEEAGGYCTELQLPSETAIMALGTASDMEFFEQYPRATGMGTHIVEYVKWEGIHGGE